MESASSLPLELGIRIIDNLLSPDEQRLVYQFLSTGGWQYGWRSNLDNQSARFWHRHLAGITAGEANEKDSLTEGNCANELALTAPLIHTFWQALSQSVLADRVLTRCYANGLPYGSYGSTHTDSLRPGASTAIYYPHDAWDCDWGGETILFNQDKSDVLAAVYPKPNRLLIFPGFVHHVARGVTPSCPLMRITLMFKTQQRDPNRP